MKIYEGKYKAWDLLITILTDLPFGLVRQCDEMHTKIGRL